MNLFSKTMKVQGRKDALLFFFLLATETILAVEEDLHTNNRKHLPTQTNKEQEERNLQGLFMFPDDRLDVLATVSFQDIFSEDLMTGLDMLSSKCSSDESGQKKCDFFSVNSETEDINDDTTPTVTPSFSPTNSPTKLPSASPSAAPTKTPTNQPTTSPTFEPTRSPTTTPTITSTNSPTIRPTNRPTERPTPSPTNAPPPTNAPTEETLWVEPNEEPRQPRAGYFNYDRDSDYGPSRWNQVDTSDHWLKEFGPNGFGIYRGHIDYDPSDNQCGKNVRRQSPKDMKPTVECDAHHEIRTWCGTHGVSSDQYEANILPHKLSLSMNRRPCLDVESRACRNQLPPRADYPRYASAGTSYADLINYDIKIPSEHTIDGKRFDAEVQMFHIHPVGGRQSSIGVVIEAKEGRFNDEFQEIIDQFQDVYNSHMDACPSARRKLNAWEEMQAQFSQNGFESLKEELGNVKQPDPTSAPDPTNAPTPGPTTKQMRKFNPYSDALMPTIFFYRYDGSITEPPCKDITWWVMTDPIVISPGQLLQLQNLLFTNVDPDDNCQATSVHNADQSVARPTFPLGNDREIQDCAAGAFKPDFVKHGGIAKKCRV